MGSWIICAQSKAGFDLKHKTQCIGSDDDDQECWLVQLCQKPVTTVWRITENNLDTISEHLAHFAFLEQKEWLIMSFQMLLSLYL